MKRNAVVRIIIFSLIILLLVGVLLAGLGISMYTFRVDTLTESYIVGNGEIPAREIHEIEIEWAAGIVQIQTADTDTISFQEKSEYMNAEPMVYHQNGNKLTIEYQAPKIHFGFGPSDSKELLITVPKDWYGDSISVDAASANLFINGLVADDLELNIASGDCHITSCELIDLEVDCASGNVYYDGTLKTMDCSAASGKVVANFKNIPSSIDFEGASADLELTLPEDAGFTVELDTLSGYFGSEFDTTRRGELYTCGDGSCKINVDGMSGDVIIHKATRDIPNTR